jgi:hypothetical protein
MNQAFCAVSAVLAGRRGESDRRASCLLTFRLEASGIIHKMALPRGPHPAHCPQHLSHHDARYCHQHGAISGELPESLARGSRTYRGGVRNTAPCALESGKISHGGGGPPLTLSRPNCTGAERFATSVLGSRESRPLLSACGVSRARLFLHPQYEASRPPGSPSHERCGGQPPGVCCN